MLDIHATALKSKTVRWPVIENCEHRRQACHLRYSQRGPSCMQATRRGSKDLCNCKPCRGDAASLLPSTFTAASGIHIQMEMHTEGMPIAVTHGNNGGVLAAEHLQRCKRHAHHAPLVRADARNDGGGGRWRWRLPAPPRRCWRHCSCSCSCSCRSELMLHTNFGGCCSDYLVALQLQRCSRVVA